MNAITLPKPLSADDETVTLSRAAWDALMVQVEDLEDLTAVGQWQAHVAAVGEAAAARECYTAAEVERMLDGASALAIWRDRAGLSQRGLAEKAGISPSYIAEIEGGKKPGSAAALRKLAMALNIRTDVLIG